MYFRLLTSHCLLFTFILGQSPYNPNPTKYLIAERGQFFPDTYKKQSTPLPFLLSYNQYFYYNTNQPNLENHNGLYFSKGFGSVHSLLLQYKGKHLILSAEPQFSYSRAYPISLHEKKALFSVLNDVPFKEELKRKINNYKNMGFIVYYSGLKIGYGNWDQWWGPGIHNSLVMSNNAEGLPYYFIETMDYFPIYRGLEYHFKYTVSDPILNNASINYFISAWYFNMRYRNIEFGSSRHVISGGYNNLHWTFEDALGVLITQENMKYWDQIYDVYLGIAFPSSGLKIFLELGLPGRTYADKEPQIYHDHGMANNMGMRKYGAFGNDNLMLGFEYTNLIQGGYYNIMPTPNWYDNIKYNYSSYKGRRWAAHSGSDSDDFLVFIGYMNEKASIIYGLNYERHGVAYHFPPEVKFETRISTSFKYNNTYIYINYENEYFEHYGFVDNNKNVWEETFESGSIQRTQTLLISIEHKFTY